MFLIEKACCKVVPETEQCAWSWILDSACLEGTDFTGIFLFQVNLETRL